MLPGGSGTKFLPAWFPAWSYLAQQERPGRAGAPGGLCFSQPTAPSLSAEHQRWGHNGDTTGTPPALSPWLQQRCSPTHAADVHPPGPTTRSQAGPPWHHPAPRTAAGGGRGRSRGRHGRRDRSAGATPGLPGAAGEAAGTGRRGGQEDTRQRRLSVTLIINASPLHFANNSQLSLSGDKWPL